jgi:RHS repeat-associated protein
MGGTTYAIGYSHDAMGHISTVNYPDGNQTSYTYAEGVVSGVSLTVGGSTVNGASAITYRPADQAMSAWTSSNGLSNTLGYDNDGRLTAIWVPGVQSLGFTYDSANRLTQVANGIDTALTQNFGYDEQSRLVSVYASADNESFQYDANGNRLMQSGTVDTVSASSNQLTSSGGTAYGYDALGNTTTVNGAATYHYDAFDRMDSAGGMAYYVNPEGQRLRKSGPAGTTYFAPDQGGTLLADYLNGGWIDYVWLNGRLIGRLAGGQVDAIHDDQLGRPEVVTDATQAVLWRAQNLAFTRNVTVASLTLNLGFPGQYYDAETGNWNNGFRDYNSLHGRYVESDPIGLGGGVNTYAYVGDNPLSYVDPLGLCPKCSSKLPDGSTIGQHVRAVAAEANQWGAVLGPLAIASIVYNGTNFRKMYGGPGANYHFLGDAGNFAYGAVAADLWIPLSATESVAGGYASVAHTQSDRAGPHGMDRSATDNVPAGYAARCLKP